MIARSLRPGALFAVLFGGCGGSTPAPPSRDAIAVTGTLFARPFTAASALLVHPQQWKSAAAGSTAVLISDTANLCAQITSGKTTAPGRLLIVRLEQRDAAAAITTLSPGSFTRQGEGTASSQFGDVFANGVDNACTFEKLFTDQVGIDVSAVGPGGASIAGSFNAHYANGESVAGTFSLSSGRDEAAVDAYLNRNPACT